MKVIAAKNIGFCFGVERAIEIARKEWRTAVPYTPTVSSYITLLS